MFAQLLVPIDGSHESRVAVEQAIALASEEKASLSGLFVADRRLIEAPIHPVHPSATSHDSEISPAMLAWMARTRGQFRKQGELALRTIAELCEMNGIPCETELVEGLIDETILNRAQQADLMIMGFRGEDTEWPGAPLGSHFEAVVRQSPQPVLGVPAKVTVMDHILLAFDGSPRGFHALEIAAYLARNGHRNLTILTINVDPFRTEALNLSARRYLQDQDVSVTYQFRKGPVVNMILQTAENEGCDLIILGAYGHNPDQPGRLGSDAYAILQATNMPVLVCR